MPLRTATGAVSNEVSITGSPSDSTIDAQVNLTAAGGISYVTVGLSGPDPYLEFGGFVSGDQTIDVSGASVVIDQPEEFHGTVDLHDSSHADLLGMAQADSWSYANDLLSIKGTDGRVIDTLHLVSDAPSTGGVHGLSVSKTAAGDVLVSPGTDFSGSLVLPTT